MNPLLDKYDPNPPATMADRLEKINASFGRPGYRRRLFSSRSI
jgi:hypothetical protein